MRDTTMATMAERGQQRKRRIPKLSSKPEPGTGRYYASYRDPAGKPRRQRFSNDRAESELAYHRWVVENYDQSAAIIAPAGNIGKGNINQSLPAIANAYIQHEKQRVRTDGARRAKGTISLRVFDDNRRQVVSILQWCKQRYAARLGRTPLDQLVTATDYESMMLSFVTRLSDSQINKHRQRFWEIVRFARRAPYGIRLPFGHEDVRKFGGTELRKSRSIPTVKMIQGILKAATPRERLWIWMGLGLGFGNDDLSRARVAHFDADSYDMRRGKTGFARYGVMRPLVWLHLRDYLKDNPREADELLFVTRNGRPLVWVTAKSKDEMVNGTSTRGPAKTPFKRCDSMAQAWRKLKMRAGVEDWREGFYVWRHLGATAYASLPGTGIAQLRTYLGHGKSNAADEYLKPLTPETKQVVEWINLMLDSDDLNAWKKKANKESVKELP